MKLSTLQLNSGYGIYQNQGFDINAQLDAQMNAYLGISYMHYLTLSKTNGVGILSSPTMASLETLSANTCPALCNYPCYSNIVVGINGFTGFVRDNTYTYLGSGNLRTFVKNFALAVNYANNANQFINSSDSSQSYLGPTYTNSDSLTSAGLTNFSTDLPSLSADLKKLGDLIDLSNLENFGTPLAFLQQLKKLNGVLPPALSLGFVAAGIDQELSLTLSSPYITITDGIQKIMYNVMANIKGDKLAQVMKVCNVTTPNITSVADLLNIRKILPNSYTSLLCPTITSYEHIYTTKSSVNSNLNSVLPAYCMRATDAGVDITSYDRLSVITTAELALSNKAFAVSLLQITGIIDLTLPEFSLMLDNVTPVDQPLISSLSTPVPSYVDGFYKSMFVSNTIDQNRVSVGDIFGSAAGFNMTDPWRDVNKSIHKLHLGPLTNICSTMYQVIIGTYGISPVDVPVGVIGTGTYISRDDAVSTMYIPLALSAIATIESSSPTIIQHINSEWQIMCDQIIRERQYQDLSDINVSSGSSTNDSVSVGAFVHSLPTYGLDKTKHGSREFLMAIADRSHMSGQAIYTCVRQSSGKNSLKSMNIKDGDSI